LPAGISNSIFPSKVFFFALGGALGQAVGLVLSKKGIGDYDAMAATQIRAIFGFGCFALLVTYLKRWKGIFGAVKDAKSMQSLTVGTVFGPFVGVALSLLPFSMLIPAWPRH